MDAPWDWSVHRQPTGSTQRVEVVDVFSVLVGHRRSELSSTRNRSESRWLTGRAMVRATEVHR
jgi:hypothetical protein